MVLRSVYDVMTFGNYALLRLDRKVSGHTPLAINRDQNLKVGTKLFVIGYPNGLPVKIAGNAEIRSVHNDYFAANLDTFRGNSGSPVFNAETYLIEGILVDGVGDYRYGYFGGMVDPKNPHNYKPGTTMKYENDNGREKAAKISLIEAFIPVTELETAIMETRKKDINIGKTGDIQSIQGQYQGETEFVPAIYYPEPEPEKTNVYKI
ncbi:MAG: serine protease [Elusimicrobia bacterium]|nr:serine protease [Elusimicrobiota bacterium]